MSGTQGSQARRPDTAPDGPPRRHTAAEAARTAGRPDTSHVVVPGVGTLTVPSPGRCAFYAGLGVAAAAGLVEWPVAVAVGVGHALTENRRSQTLREFGDALEDA